MKTLEEKVDKFLKSKNITESYTIFSEDGRVAWDFELLLEEFTQQEVNSALQEAAEKAKYDAEYFYSPQNDFQNGRIFEAKALQKFILSLQIKDK